MALLHMQVREYESRPNKSIEECLRGILSDARFTAYAECQARDLARIKEKRMV